MREVSPHFPDSPFVLVLLEKHRKFIPRYPELKLDWPAFNFWELKGKPKANNI